MKFSRNPEPNETSVYYAYYLPYKTRKNRHGVYDKVLIIYVEFNERI